MKRISIGACAVLFAACGSSSSPGSLDSIGGDLAKATCKQIFRCCTQAEVMTQFMDTKLNGQPITTESQCDQFYGLFSTFLGSDYKTSISKGRMSYDQAAAKQCLDQLASASCAQYNGTGDADLSCPPFITPLVADGGGCTQDYECTSNHCEGASNNIGSASTDGMCQALPGAGQACTFDCAKGFYCGFDQASGMEICLALKANAATCQSSQECTSDNCVLPSGGGSGACADKAPMCTGA